MSQPYQQPFDPYNNYGGYPQSNPQAMQQQPYGTMPPHMPQQPMQQQPYDAKSSMMGTMPPQQGTYMNTTTTTGYQQQQPQQMQGMYSNFSPQQQQQTVPQQGMYGSHSTMQPSMTMSQGIPSVVWIWQLNDTTFAPFPQQVIMRIEESYNRRTDRLCMIEMNGRQWTVDLESLCLYPAESRGEDKNNKRFVCRVDMNSLLTGRPVDMTSTNSQITNPIKRKKEKKDKKKKDKKK
jgi:hypothetical protein